MVDQATPVTRGPSVVTVRLAAPLPDEVGPAIEKSLSINDRPVLIEFVVDPEEMVFPMVPAGAPSEFSGFGNIEHRVGAIPGGIDIGFHVGVMNEHGSAGVKDDVIRISQSAGDAFDHAAFDIRANDRSAGSFDALAVSARIFVSRQQIAFV